MDDSAIIRQRLRRMLANVANVEIAGESGNALEATNAILQNKPDVVLLDIHLLDGSGIDVLEAVKKGQTAPAVIVLTNYPYSQYRRKCIQAGADYFFVKSTEFDQVIPALEKLSNKTDGSGSGGEDLTRSTKSISAEESGCK